LDYKPAAELARQVAETILNSKFNPEIVLNLNVPYLPLEDIKGLQVTRQGQRVYQDELITRSDPRGVPYYWIGGDPPTGVPDQGTDIGALKEGYASLTPLKLDLTAGEYFEPLAKLFSGAIQRTE
jgi:5'-nucleotidase